MATKLEDKSTTAEIRERFDNDVERFSNFATGQQTIPDARLMLELLADVATSATPNARHMLDIGCGAGNNTLMMLRHNANLQCDLLDLSLPMLEKAGERVSAESPHPIQTFHEDIRTVPLKDNHYDIIVAAAVLHHLREDADWEFVFTRIFNALAPGGGLWISDMVFHDDARVHARMWQRYGTYLETLGGVEFREKVFAYIDREDSPRSVTFQIELMKQVGFTHVDVLHKNSNFAAYGGLKPQTVIPA